MSENKKLTLITILTMLILIIIGVGVYFLIEDKPKTQNLSLGEYGEVNQWNMSITDYDYYNNGNNTYIVNVYITAENRSQSAKTFIGDMNITLLYIEGDKKYKYNYSFNWDNELFSSTMPLCVESDYIVFTIPSQAIESNSGQLLIQASKNIKNPKTILVWELKKQA